MEVLFADKQTALNPNRLKELKVTIPINFPLPGGMTLVQGPLSYNSDGLATRHNCDFIGDPQFEEAYQAGLDVDYPGFHKGYLGSWWRIFVCCWAGFHAKHLEGDFVECGVAFGRTSRSVMQYIGFSEMVDRKFYLLDTYSGLSFDLLTEEERKLGFEEAYKDDYPESFEFVKQNFASFINVIIIKGVVPDTLPQVTSEKICYLHIDMNCVVPEIAAGEYFWERLVPGAPVILDDYGYGGNGHITQKRGWDAFADERDIKILALPTGQGLFFKV